MLSPTNLRKPSSRQHMAVPARWDLKTGMNPLFLFLVVIAGMR